MYYLYRMYNNSHGNNYSRDHIKNHSDDDGVDNNDADYFK